MKGWGPAGLGWGGPEATEVKTQPQDSGNLMCIEQKHDNPQMILWAVTLFIVLVRV